MVYGSTNIRPEVYKVYNQKPKKFQPKQPHKPIKPCFRFGIPQHTPAYPSIPQHTPAQCKFMTAQGDFCTKVWHNKSNCNILIVYFYMLAYVQTKSTVLPLPSHTLPPWTQSCHVLCNIHVIITLTYYVFCVYMRNSINTVVYYDLYR